MASAERSRTPIGGTAAMSGGWPDVAVVMPVRNEATDLRDAVAAVLAQEYPGTVQICLAVAPSTDGTEAVAAELAAEHDDVIVVDNPAGTTPAGLNAAIRATTGDVVVRVDGHAELSPGYIRRAVETLRRTGAANVGGVQRAVGTTPFEEAVADAMTSRFGTGDATFHYGGAEGPTDTVYLGVFDRAAIERVGLYDERLVRNQDYELNIRLRQAGGVVWFDPELVGLVPAARLAAGPGQAVLRVRAVEAIGRPPAPAVAALAPGRSTGGDRGGHRRCGRRAGLAQGVGRPRRVRRRRRGRGGDRRQVSRPPRLGCWRSSRRCTCRGAPASCSASRPCTTVRQRAEFVVS